MRNAIENGKIIKKEETIPLIKKLLTLINQPDLDNDDVAEMKNIICYLSDIRSKLSESEVNINLVEYLLFSASNRLRAFGHNKLNDFEKNKFIQDPIDELVLNSVESYYESKTGFILDRYQKEVLDSFFENKNRLFLSAPTSFGKTFLLKEIIFKNYENYKNIVIVLPTIALLFEVSQDLASFFKTKELNYEIYTSVYKDINVTERKVYILTPERVLRLLATSNSFTPDFIFFDEIYKIDEDVASSEDDVENNNFNKAKYGRSGGDRAIAFRLALYLLMEKKCDCYIAGPYIRLDSMKKGLARFFEKYSIFSQEVSFVPTMKNLIVYQGKNMEIKSPVIGEMTEPTPYKNKNDKLKFLVDKLRIGGKEPGIVYCLYPKFTEKYAREFCKNLRETTDKEILVFLDHIIKNYNCIFNNSENSVDKWIFVYALKRGIGIHNGTFPRYIQKEIMNLFNKNKLDLLFCTSTIVEGVNTNAKTIILYNNPSGKSEAGKRFLLLNINGRSGRYLRHFVGNIVYMDKKCTEIENASDISLDFKLFNSEIDLGKLDLENTSDEDLSDNNRRRKQEIPIDKNILPDEVFYKNRLIERTKQEKILKIIMNVSDSFQGIYDVSISEFIEEGYLEKILLIWKMAESLGDEFQIDKIIFIAKQYAQNGYLGVLDERFRTYKGEKVYDFVNDTYRNVFKEIRDFIEYQFPRIISLFESLINQAFLLKGLESQRTLDLSKVIRYFEIGTNTLLGTDMIEKGVPSITVRKIEKHQYFGDSLFEQKQSFKQIYKKIDLDEYEYKMICNYMFEN